MPREKALQKTQRAREICLILERDFPNVRTALEYNNAFELLIATILSAQCTDIRVNKVTPHLFREAPTPQAMVSLGIEKLEKLIGSINFFHNKARNILLCSEKLIAQHNSRVPQSLEELIELPGVGRKTANVVLGEVYKVPGIVVDTHVLRISNRLALSRSEDAVEVEQDLEKIIEKHRWIDLSHLFILHGRKTCTARKPLCGICPIASLCPSQGKRADAWKKGN